MARRNDPVTDYARRVVAGKVAAGRFVRMAGARHLRDLKRKELTWRLDRALHIIEFYREMLVLENGDAFLPLDWQQFVLGSCFGWYVGDYRRFRTAYVETGKGSGKTPLAAGIGIYAAVADGEPAPEIYSAATERDQAKIVWKDAWRMVKANPELDDLFESPDSSEVQLPSLSIPGDMAVFRPVSAEHRGLDGKRVHVALVDELHEHPGPMVVDKMRAGTKRRRNALIFEITNSGFDRTSVCWAHHEMSTQVLQGLVQNDAWFAYVCTLDPCDKCLTSGKQFPDCERCDDWKDPKVWPKANPALGQVLPVSYLREQVDEAIGMPSKENIVKRLNFCIWTEASDRWLGMEQWDACAGPALRLEDFRARECYAGLDGADTDDVFAFVMAFPQGPGDEAQVDVIARFWIPGDTLSATGGRRTEENRRLLRQWVDQGHIKATDGAVIDYDQVEADIKADLAKVRLRRLSFDRFNVSQLITHLRDSLGEKRVVDFPQSMAAMTAPAKDLEKRLKDRTLRHGGNPVLRWMASNVALKFGPNKQIKPDRERSGEKIDGIIGLVEALDGIARRPKRPQQSMEVLPCG